MRRLGAGLLVALIGSGAIIASVRAVMQPALTPPTTRVANCTEGGCHAAQIEKKFLHGPNAVQACDACHDNVDPAKHAFQLKRPGQQLCNFCHIDKTGREGPVVHKPVADGQCLGCHDPHGSSSPKMLKKDTTPELCLSCHKEIVSADHVHKPVSEDCAKCHRPHTSNNEKLLTMDKRSLCLSCHENVAKTIAGAPHPHEPTKGDCLQCHQPHASNEIKELRAAPKDLCLSCHKQVTETINNCKRPHGAVTDGRSCLNCHTPHGSDQVKQLVQDQTGTCLQCHKDPIVVSKEKTVPGVPELAAPGLHKHGPVAEDNCAACHGVHGGERDNLLVANFTTNFYQAFSEDAYELCFKCHNKSLILAQPAQDQTKFRDGSRNLHAVHVNGGSTAQGRSCRACHTVHASRFENQINETVPFGQWRLPINYAATETGGSCAPGCHRAQKYDRITPASLPSFPPGAPAKGAEPTSSPASTPAPAKETKGSVAAPTGK